MESRKSLIEELAGDLPPTSRGGCKEKFNRRHSDDTGSSDCQVVRMKELKSCLRTKTYQSDGVHRIKTVTFGSITTKPFILTEGEVNWKRNHFNLQFVEVRRRYIRDISKREITLYGLYKSDYNLAVVDSQKRISTRSLYRQPTQSPDDSYRNTSETMEPRVPATHPITGHLFSEASHLQEAEKRVIFLNESAKEMMTNRMRQLNNLSMRNGKSLEDYRKINKRDLITMETKASSNTGRLHSDPKVNFSTSSTREDWRDFSSRNRGNRYMFTSDVTKNKMQDPSTYVASANGSSISGLTSLSRVKRQSSVKTGIHGSFSYESNTDDLASLPRFSLEERLKREVRIKENVFGDLSTLFDCELHLKQNQNDISDNKDIHDADRMSPSSEECLDDVIKEILEGDSPPHTYRRERNSWSRQPKSDFQLGCSTDGMRINYVKGDIFKCHSITMPNCKGHSCQTTHMLHPPRNSEGRGVEGYERLAACATLCRTEADEDEMLENELDSDRRNSNPLVTDERMRAIGLCEDRSESHRVCQTKRQSLGPDNHSDDDRFEPTRDITNSEKGPVDTQCSQFQNQRSRSSAAKVQTSNKKDRGNQFFNFIRNSFSNFRRKIKSVSCFSNSTS